MKDPIKEITDVRFKQATEMITFINKQAMQVEVEKMIFL